MLFLIAVTIFAAVAIAAWAVLRPKDDNVDRRIHSESFREQVREVELEANVGRRIFAPAVHKVGSLLTRLVPQDAVKRLEHMLVVAGEPMTLPVYLAFWVGLVMFGGLVLIYLMLVKPDASPLRL